MSLSGSLIGSTKNIFGIGFSVIKIVIIIFIVIITIVAIWFTIKNIKETIYERKALKEHQDRIKKIVGGENGN